MAWSDLLPEILAIIVREFDYAGDLVRFACVCTSWRVVAMDWRYYVSPQLPVRVSVFPGLSRISSYDPLIDRVAMLDHPSGLDGEIIGSGSGWIVVLRPRHAEVYLWSPFLGMELDLPSLHHYEDDVFWMVEGHILDDSDPDPADAYQYDCGLVHKVVVVHMSRAPGGFGAIAIYNGSAKLAYAKPGDESWTAIGVHRSRYRDAVLYEGQLYAIDAFGFIRIYDFVGGIERAVVDIRHYIFGGADFFTAALRYRFYIVPTSTDIYVVAREFSDRVTTAFTIYRMDIEARGIARVEQIGDHAFFVGGTTLSASIRTRDFIGLAHSSIWYTADYPYSIRPDVPYDVGVHDVELGTFQRVPMFSQLESRDYVMPPVWITRFPW